MAAVAGKFFVCTLQGEFGLCVVKSGLAGVRPCSLNMAVPTRIAETPQMGVVVFVAFRTVRGGVSVLGLQDVTFGTLDIFVTAI